MTSQYQLFCKIVDFNVMVIYSLFSQQFMFAILEVQTRKLNVIYKGTCSSDLFIPTAAGTKVTLGFGDSIPPKSPLQTEVSSPDMEGPIALIAPELPEDTLFEVRT